MRKPFNLVNASEGSSEDRDLVYRMESRNISKPHALSNPIVRIAEPKE